MTWKILNGGMTIRQTPEFRHERQGLKIKNKNIMLSDLFAKIVKENDPIPSRVTEAFPDLTKQEYQSATHLMWLLMIAIEYSGYYAQVENNGKMDFEQLESWLINYRKHLQQFRKNPRKYLGYEE